MVSDAAVASIVTGVITVVGMVIGYLKLKNKMVEKADAVAKKVDENTSLTVEAKNATDKMGDHAVSCDERWKLMDAIIHDHGNRINALEVETKIISSKIDALGDSVRTTRHSLQNQLAAIVQKLDLMMFRTNPGTVPVAPVPTAPMPPQDQR